MKGGWLYSAIMRDNTADMRVRSKIKKAAAYSLALSMAVHPLTGYAAGLEGNYAGKYGDSETNYDYVYIDVNNNSNPDAKINVTTGEVEGSVSIGAGGSQSTDISVKSGDVGSVEINISADKSGNVSVETGNVEGDISVRQDSDTAGDVTVKSKNAGGVNVDIPNATDGEGNVKVDVDDVSGTGVRVNTPGTADVTAGKIVSEHGGDGLNVSSGSGEGKASADSVSVSDSYSNVTGVTAKGTDVDISGDVDAMGNLQTEGVISVKSDVTVGGDVTAVSGGLLAELDEYTVMDDRNATGALNAECNLTVKGSTYAIAPGTAVGVANIGVGDEEPLGTMINEMLGYNTGDGTQAGAFKEAYDAWVEEGCPEGGLRSRLEQIPEAAPALSHAVAMAKTKNIQTIGGNTGIGVIAAGKTETEITENVEVGGYDLQGEFFRDQAENVYGTLAAQTYLLTVVEPEADEAATSAANERPSGTDYWDAYERKYQEYCQTKMAEYEEKFAEEWTARVRDQYGEQIMQIVTDRENTPGQLRIGVMAAGLPDSDKLGFSQELINKVLGEGSEGILFVYDDDW